MRPGAGTGPIRLWAVKTWTISTDDGDGQLELHTFLPAGPAAGAAAKKARSGVVVLHGTLVTDALYWPFARRLSRLTGRPVHCYNRRGRAGSSRGATVRAAPLSRRGQH